MVDFSTHARTFANAEITVAAASVDTIDTVADLRDGLRVGFPMYGELDIEQVHEATGAFIQTGDRTFVHATGFLVRPDGVLAQAVYASGPIGRFSPDDILRVVAFVRAQN